MMASDTSSDIKSASSDIKSASSDIKSASSDIKSASTDLISSSLDIKTISSDIKSTLTSSASTEKLASIQKKTEPEIEDDGGSSATESESDEKYDQSDKSSGSDSMSIEGLRLFLAEKLGLKVGEIKHKKKEKHELIQIIDPLTFEGLMGHWKSKPFKNIITMVGAGISTSAGIPDFRSPNTGLYNNLQKYNLPYPTAVFQLDYFIDNPKPFFSLAKELYPGNFKPTPCHYFIRLLQDKGVLLRHYTQNIDTLDRIAKISEDKLVEAHGTFHTGHCLKCHREHSQEYMREQIFADKIPQCLEKPCGGIVKPDIVFFGDNLPEKFYTLPEEDFAKCDLLIIMGTSLEVQPFASLINRVEDDCVRLLVNRDKVGQNKMFWDDEGLLFNSPHNTRDIAWLGDCDDGIKIIADSLGYGHELDELIIREYYKLDNPPEEEEEGEEEEKTDVSTKTTPSTETL